MKPVELIHGEVKIKMLFVNLTTMNVLKDLGIDPSNAVDELKLISSDKLGLMNLLKSIIYNGMKVYCEDYDKVIPYRRSQILDLIIKDTEGESNLGNVLMMFVESVSGKTSEEILKEVEQNQETEKKMIGSDGTTSSNSTAEKSE